MPDQSGSREFEALRAFSARVGADPALVQAAGGNTSIKQDGVLWIKASGTWLMNAQSGNIMVPVAVDPLLDALARNDPAAEKAQDFVIAADNPLGLRPSIETTLHAIFPQRIVVHVHCVETIAIAVRTDAERVLASRLNDLEWAFVPYARPGLPLSRACAKRMRPRTNVLVLGNHGLVVAGETVADVSMLLSDVCRRLAQPVRENPPPDLMRLERLAGKSGYGMPVDSAAHAAATDPVNCAIAARGSLYPDHVIFLGAGSVVAQEGEDADTVRARLNARQMPDPVSILFPAAGILMHEDASASAHAMARCLADVTARIPPGVDLRYFSPDEDDELLNWDAEKYRQSLEAEAGRQHRLP